MTPERWQQIQQIYESALARETAARASYLAEACVGDEGLRMEIGTLLAHAESAEHFIEQPAIAAPGALAGLSGLSIGHCIGPYQIVAKLGAGGMGEVYRAHDTQLGREVAIKIVPQVFASDPDRLARFEREARLLGSLNHPHIATVHGLEPFASSRALVMELVEGPTLADRIARGPLAVSEALPVACQIAEALEAAHEKGIVHRDLKPANIKITPDSIVKVLDFGLAKAIRPPEDAPELPDSPAFTTGGMKDGVLLGTAAYMSPEQVRGQAVDNRADIWAFGCVLYEMLSGRRAFQGDEVSDVLAGILRDDPEWDALPASTPQSVRRLVRRCLEKDRRERLQAIGDARLEISEALIRRTDDEPTATPRSHTSRAKSIVPLAAVAGATALVVGIGTWMLKPSSPAAERLIARSLIAVDPFDQRPAASTGETRPSIGGPFRTAIAVSPDGRTLVFRGMRGVGQQGWQLFLRPLDRLEAAPIPGTEGAQNPFFSPDGAWIGYWADREIRRVPTAGGPPSTVARVPSDYDGPPRTVGASWGDGDVIVFATPDAVWRVASSGGTPETVTKPREGEYAYITPQMLPGGRAVLFTLQKTLYRWDDAQIVVRSLVTGEQKVLLDDGADARYVPSGHLVFVRRGTLMAVPFDPVRLTLTGAPVAMIDGVMQAANNGNVGQDSGAGQFAIAAQGRLIYVTGGITPDEDRALVWVDRNGNVEPLVAPRLEYMAPRLAPNGQRVVVSTRRSASGGGDRIWIHDIARETFTSLTSQRENSLGGVWSPDGARIAFSTLLPGRGLLSLRSVDWPGSSEPLVTGDRTFPPAPNSWSPDGRIAFVQHDDIWELTATDRRAHPIVQTPANEWHPAFSPDGKWLAYSSDHSGREEVYVQPYPGPGPRVTVSTEGGAAPAWSGDGTELFYLTFRDGAPLVVNAVPVKATASAFSAGPPRKLFEGRYIMTGPMRSYDVTPDGQRFLMVQRPDPRPSRPKELVLVENWLDELRRRVPSKP